MYRRRSKISRGLLALTIILAVTTAISLAFFFNQSFRKAALETDFLFLKAELGNLNRQLVEIQEYNDGVRDSSDWKEYDIDEHHMAIKYPKNWELDVKTKEDHSGRYIDFGLREKKPIAQGIAFITAFRFYFYEKENEVETVDWIKENKDKLHLGFDREAQFDFQTVKVADKVLGVEMCVPAGPCLPPLFEHKGIIYQPVMGQDANVFEGYTRISSISEILKTIELY